LLVRRGDRSIVLLLEYVLPQFTPIFEQAVLSSPLRRRADVLGTAVGAAGRGFSPAFWRRPLVARQLLARPPTGSSSTLAAALAGRRRSSREALAAR